LPLYSHYTHAILPLYSHYPLPILSKNNRKFFKKVKSGSFWAWYAPNGMKWNAVLYHLAGLK
jgi:hypothetical protein